MSNLSQAIKEEIVRLSRKEVKAAVNPVRKANFTLKLAVAELKRKVFALESANKGLRKAVKPAVEQVAPEEIEKARFTARTIKKLREKLGASQDAFAKFLGMSSQAIHAMEHKVGRLRFRGGTLEGLLKARKLKKRDFQKMSDGLTQRRGGAEGTKAKKTMTRKKRK